MEDLKEEPRPVFVVVGEWPKAQVYAMVGYDMVSGDSWSTFPPKSGSIPTLVGDPPKQANGFLYYCRVKWNTENGDEHEGVIQVTPVLPPEGHWTVEQVVGSK